MFLLRTCIALFRLVLVFVFFICLDPTDDRDLNQTQFLGLFLCVIVNDNGYYLLVNSTHTSCFIVTSILCDFFQLKHLVWCEMSNVIFDCITERNDRC